MPEANAPIASRLDAFLASRWPLFRERVCFEPDPARFFSFAQLADPHTLGGCLHAFAQHYPQQDERALASLWAQWHVATAWPPLIATALVLGESPRLYDSHAGIFFDTEHRPAGLGLPPDCGKAPADAFERFVREQADALFGTLARISGIAPRVVWSNAANVFVWTLGELRGLDPSLDLTAGYTLLRQPVWTDGHANPLFTVLDSNLQRRVCCLRYCLDRFDYCSDCPITCRSIRTPAARS